MNKQGHTAKPRRWKRKGQFAKHFVDCMGDKIKIDQVQFSLAGPPVDVLIY